MYLPYHPGTFFVLVSSETRISTRKKICELHLFVKLQKINITDYACNNVGNIPFRLTFNNAVSANSSAQNVNLKQIDLKAFIPEKLVQRFYIIKNVAKSITVITIKQQIEANNDVVSVYRFSRKTKNNTFEYTETIKICIIYDGLPTETTLTPELCVPLLASIWIVPFRCRSRKKCLNCGTGNKNVRIVGQLLLAKIYAARCVVFFAAVLITLQRTDNNAQSRNRRETYAV